MWVIGMGGMMNERSGFRSALGLSILAFTQGAMADETPRELSAREIPAGVAYHRVSPERLATAADALRRWIAAGPESLAAHLGGNGGADPLPVGPYLSAQVDATHIDLPKQFRRAAYNVDFEGTAIRAQGVIAMSAEQKRLLAQFLYLQADLAQPGELRAATFEEIGLVWGWIAWDIDEPFFVWQSGSERVVFDLDDSGAISWLDRLTDTCLGHRAEGDRPAECQCLGVTRDEKTWKASVSSRPRCDESHDALTAMPQVSTPGAIVLQTTAPTQRLDAPIARRIAHSRAIRIVADDAPGFAPVGKLLRGGAVQPPAGPETFRGLAVAAVIVDERGAATFEPILYSDPRLLDSIGAAVKEWKFEPARLAGKPVSQLFWVQFSY